jgi:hypothetical protein
MKTVVWEFVFEMLDMTVGLIVFFLFWAMVLPFGCVVGLGVREALKLLGAL